MEPGTMRWRIDGASLWLETGNRLTFQRVPQIEPEAGAVSWRSHGALPPAPAGSDLLLPVASDEAFWIGIEAETPGAPLRVRVVVAGCDGSARDAVTGAAPVGAFASSPRNYLVCPPQRALDGVTAPGGPRPFARVTDFPDRYHACGSVTIRVRRVKAVLAFRLVLVSFEDFRAATGWAPAALNASSAYGGWLLPE